MSLTVIELENMEFQAFHVKSHILEHVARRIIDAIYRRFPPTRRVRVKVSKMAPPLGGKIERVSVSLEK